MASLQQENIYQQPFASKYYLEKLDKLESMIRENK